MSSPELPPEFQQDFSEFAAEPVEEPEIDEPEDEPEDDAVVAEGPWYVRLLIPVDSAIDAADAVEGFIYDITDNGLRDYLFRVIHVPTEEVYYVQRGEILTEEEALGNIEDEDDDEDDDE